MAAVFEVLSRKPNDDRARSYWRHEPSAKLGKHLLTAPSPSWSIPSPGDDRDEMQRLGANKNMGPASSGCKLGKYSHTPNDGFRAIARLAANPIPQTAFPKLSQFDLL
jgi:hypothetical protein